MRMTLARKGLLAHVQVIKAENKITKAWLINDAKALAIIAQEVELQHQTKIRSAVRIMEAWNTLREYYNRTTVHNRVAMTRRLHEFKMEEGTPMAMHLDAFDELVVGLQTLREPVDEARQLVLLLSYLNSEHELIASKVENSKDITLTEFKETLMKEHERLQKKVTTEKAGATSHMTPCREDLFDVEGMIVDIEVTIADGTNLRVTGQGTVRLTSLTGKHINMMEVLYNPGLDRQLLSARKLAERGLTEEFQLYSCVGKT
ncbi:Putative Polyprotein [Phytophthora palmivora]|uniref:Polyprotein n=1 Tax=Phytophthora palmivora TaxID=4796 RepID=A0A2P4XV87_9STRA|nr:Putative Polyprotein [Phytophthora palmivora]